jgi:hypothetical protein
MSKVRLFKVEKRNNRFWFECVEQCKVKFSSLDEAYSHRCEDLLETAGWYQKIGRK